MESKSFLSNTSRHDKLILSLLLKRAIFSLIFFVALGDDTGVALGDDTAVALGDDTKKKLSSPDFFPSSFKCLFG